MLELKCSLDLWMRVGCKTGQEKQAKETTQIIWGAPVIYCWRDLAPLGWEAQVDTEESM